MSVSDLGSAVLKNGESIRIELWDLDALKEFVSLVKLPVLKRGETRHFEGFHYLGPRLIPELMETYGPNYRDAKVLTSLEHQEELGLSNERYHRTLVALKKDEVIGIRVCQWIKDNHFWRYHTKFTDVKEGNQHIGVATNLIIALDEASFLENKILQLGVFSAEGKLYLTKPLNDHLRARNYALIPADYCLVKPPLAFGVYDNFGRRMR